MNAQEFFAAAQNAGLSAEKQTLTRANIKAILKKLDKDGCGFLSNYGDVKYEGYNAVLQKAVDSEWQGSENDVDFVGGLINAGEKVDTVYRALIKVNYLNLPLKTFALKGKTLRDLIVSLSNDAMITYAGGEGSESIMIRWYNDNKGQYEGYIITKENDKNAYVLLSEMIDDGVKKADAAREYFSLEAANDDIRFSRSASTQAKYEQAKSKSETELNYRQWVQVRTPEFKAWFGDWENDPENASKVVNPKTGEPLVVYHGTGADFDAFSEQSHRSTLNDKYQGDGFHFSADPRVASQYADAARNQVLNKDRAFAAVNREMPPKAAAIFREVVEDGYAKVWDKPDVEVRAIIDESEAAGIDLNELLDIAEWVEGSNYNKGRDALNTFDAGMIFGGIVRYLPEWVRNDAVKLGIADALPNPSVMPVYLNIKNLLRTDSREEAKNAQENGYDGVYYTGPDTVDGEPEWVVFKPEQIKSAIGNSGAFSAQNADFTQ